MRKLVLAAMMTLLAVPAFAADTGASKPAASPAATPPAKEAPKFTKAEEDKIFYAVGLAVARQLAVFSLSPQELEKVKQGMIDGVTGKTPLSAMDPYQRKMQELANARRNAQGEKLAAEAKDYIAKFEKEKGVVKKEDGLLYQSLREGTGATPKPSDTVKVNYRGTLIDGTEFDSSYRRGQPAEFPLSSVIKCWTEGVPMMKVGGKAKLVCPPELAYGAQGSGPIPGNATLVFEIELLEVKAAK